MKRNRAGARSANPMRPEPETATSGDAASSSTAMTPPATSRRPVTSPTAAPARVTSVIVPRIS